MERSNKQTFSVNSSVGLGEKAEMEVRINAISIGDSNHEREAMTRLAQMSAHAAQSDSIGGAALGSNEFTVKSGKGSVKCLTSFKSVKLLERPDLCQLGREHLLLQESLGQICSHAGNLDICIQPTVKAGSIPVSTPVTTPDVERSC